MCSFAVATVALDKLPPVHHEQVEINVFRTLLLVSMGMWRTQTSTVSHSGQRPRRQAKHPDLPSFAPSAADEYPPLHRPSLFGARLSATPWQRADPRSPGAANFQRRNHSVLSSLKIVFVFFIYSRRISPRRNQDPLDLWGSPQRSSRSPTKQSRDMVSPAKKAKTEVRNQPACRE